VQPVVRVTSRFNGKYQNLNPLNHACCGLCYFGLYIFHSLHFSSIKQSINQSKYWLSSRATSKLIVNRKNKQLVQLMVFGKDFLINPSVKSLTKGREWRRCSRVFQTRGPATVNDRSPTVERLTDDTSKLLVGLFYTRKRPQNRSLRHATHQTGKRRSTCNQLICYVHGVHAASGHREIRWCQTSVTRRRVRPCQVRSRRTKAATSPRSMTRMMSDRVTRRLKRRKEIVKKSNLGFIDVVSCSAVFRR